LIWNSSQNAEERIVRDAQRPMLWVVDGQQRATALSILFGRKWLQKRAEALSVATNSLLKSLTQ
jgi:hypothetical protein